MRPLLERAGIPNAAALQRAGLRVTAQRLAILAALAVQQRPVTARQLHGRLQAAGRGIGLTTVYRTLAALAEVGEVHAFAIDGEHRFRRCSRTSHQHLRCEVCGWVDELPGDEVERWAAGIAREHAFALRRSLVEIVGRCAACR